MEEEKEFSEDNVFSAGLLKSLNRIFGAAVLPVAEQVVWGQIHVRLPASSRRT